MSTPSDAPTNDTARGAAMTTEPTDPWTPLSPLGPTPSSAHSPAQAPAGGTAADRAAGGAPTPASAGTPAEPAAREGRTEALPVAHGAAAGAGDDADGAGGTRILPARPEPPEPDASTLDGVWSATAPRPGEGLDGARDGQRDADRRAGTARRGPRPMTIVWGLVLAALGAATIATGLGARIDLTLAAIILLAGLGVVLLVLAVLPPRRGRQ